MRLAIGYIRVSSAGQAAEGISLEAQQARIRDWAQVNGYQLEAILRDDGISGFKLRNRPGAQEAILLACQHKAALVVYSLSRLCRSIKDAVAISERLNKAGADLVSLTEPIDTTTAMGKAFYGLLAIFGQLERDLTSERTRAALHHLSANGKRLGNIPYGWQADTTRPEEKKGKVVYPYLIAEPQEQAVIAEIKRLRAIGYSIAMIAKELERQGIQTRGGTVWGLTQIKRILARTK